jgi:hypothetical protein
MDSLVGPQGEQGEQGTPGVGLSAYEVWINLGNTGTEQEFMDSLVGPQGEQGEQGTPGVGLSAYEVWINLGNTGTEQEFIDSLVGPQGEIGEGLNSLIKTSDEEAGDNCVNGGIKIEMGLDTDNSGELDEDEIDDSLTKYLCNGNDGGASLTSPSKIASIGDYKWDIPGWQFNHLYSDGASGIYITNNKIIYYPILVTKSTNFSEISLKNGNSNIVDIRVGIYSYVNGLPANIIQDLGLMITTDSAWSNKTTNFSLDPGYYFVAVTSESQGLNSHKVAGTAMIYANNANVRAISPAGNIKKVVQSSLQYGNSFIFTKPSSQIGFTEININDFVEMDHGACILFKESE